MKKHIYLSTASILSMAYAYDNKGGWKLDADGKIEMKDGNPIYVDTTGKEMTVQGDTISRLNGEARGHREAKEAAEAKLKNFDGIDPEKARNALATVEKLDQSKLIDSGKVDELKAQLTTQFQGQIQEKDKALASALSMIDNMKIERIFESSEFVNQSVAIPRDMFTSAFRNNFKIEDGKIVAYDSHGNKIMSDDRFGELATPEEALKKLVASRPDKDTILRAESGAGTGSGGKGGNSGVGRSIKRGEFEALTPTKQAEVAAKVRGGEMNLVD